MFSGLANFIVMHFKLVIALWIAVLFYVFPLIFKINDVVVYQDSEEGLQDREAMKADDLMSANFPGQVAPSTIMIVIQNTDVLSEDARNSSWSLCEDISSSSALGGPGPRDHAPAQEVELVRACQAPACAPRR
jgi:predicted RND superfamily exporter protein